jgi:ketosteroid isomerase-like protein
MSQENVEIVRRALDAFNRRDPDSYGDYVDPEAYGDLFTPDFEWLPSLVGLVEGGSYRGREGSERVLANLGQAWQEYRLLPDEFRDLGDLVLMLGRQEGRGRGGGVPVDAPIGMIFDFRGGKICRARSYLDHGEALRAAGLAEEGG